MPKLDRDDGGLLTLGLVGALALAGGLRGRGSQNEDYVGSLMRQRGIPDRGQNADWIGRAWGVGRDSHGSPMWLLDNEDDTFSLVIRDEENGEVIDVDTSPVESWEELDQMLDLATRDGHRVSRTLRERND